MLAVTTYFLPGSTKSPVTGILVPSRAADLNPLGNLWKTLTFPGSFSSSSSALLVHDLGFPLSSVQSPNLSSASYLFILITLEPLNLYPLFSFRVNSSL